MSEQTIVVTEEIIEAHPFLQDEGVSLGDEIDASRLTPGGEDASLEDEEIPLEDREQIPEEEAADYDPGILPSEEDMPASPADDEQ